MHPIRLLRCPHSLAGSPARNLRLLATGNSIFNLTRTRFVTSSANGLRLGAGIYKRQNSSRDLRPFQDHIRWSSSQTGPVEASSSKTHVTIAEPPVTFIDKLPRWARRAKPYLLLIRLDKPIGTMLLYWPCAWAITMASTAVAAPLTTPLFYLGLFGVGAIIMRGAGCTINDMWDMKIDKAVERTKLRPLAAGDITPFQASCFLGIQLSAGLAVLTQLNWYSIYLGATSLSLVVLYPFMKRVTYYPQFVLGLAFNWGAMLGWSAVAGAVDWTVAIPLYIGGIAWTVMYDTIYAHQDKLDDILVNVKSTALRFGSSSRVICSGLAGTFVSFLTLAGHLSGAGPLYYIISCGGAAIHSAWQLKNVDFDDRASCWKMFVSNQWLGAIVWMGTAGDYLARITFGLY